MEAALMAMRIVRKTLDAPDWKRRTNSNEGFVDIGEAAQAIACVKPDCAETLLEQIIAGSFDDFGVGRAKALTAYAAATGERSRKLVRDRLGDQEYAVREAAAIALGEMAKGTNDPDDIASLADALTREDRDSVIDKILIALVGIGPDAERYVRAGIDGATPGTRMELHWRLEGLSARGIANMLIEAGVTDPIDDAVLAKVTQKGVDLEGLIKAGGRRLVSIDVKSDCQQPPHHLLFEALLDIARPRIEVEDLSQTDNDLICTIRFVHAGVVHSFSAHPSGRWLDVAAVKDGFNQFMAAIGRQDRCFQLSAWGSFCSFVVAPENEFRRVAERLHIFEPHPDTARAVGMAYIRQVVAELRKRG